MISITRGTATESEHARESEVFSVQIRSIDGRAELIRKAMLLTLVSLAGTILCCLLLGLALYWEIARVLAVAIFVASILTMLAATGYYIAEIANVLSSVHEEAKYYHLMDSRELREQRHDWQRPSDG